MDGGGFPCTVWPKKPKDDSGRYIHGQAIDCLDRSKGAAKVFGVYDGFGHSFHSCERSTAKFTVIRVFFALASVIIISPQFNRRLSEILTLLATQELALAHHPEETKQ